MVDLTKRWNNSPYDEHGMPLAAETVDYDNKGDVAKASVKDKPITDYSDTLAAATEKYEEPKIDRKEPNPADFNSAVEVTGHKHPSRKDHLGIGIPELSDFPDRLDMDDPKTQEKLAQEDPKETNKTKLESDKVDHSDKPEDEKPKEEVKGKDTTVQPTDEDTDFEKALKNA